MANVVLGGHANAPSSITNTAQKKSPRFESRADSPQEQQADVKDGVELKHQSQQRRALSTGSAGIAVAVKPSKTSQPKRVERSPSARASTTSNQDSGSIIPSSGATRSISNTRVKKLWKDIKKAPGDAAPLMSPKDTINKTPTRQRSQSSKPSSSFCSSPPIDGLTELSPTAFRQACSDAIMQDPVHAKHMGFDQQLWKSWYREIDSLQGKCRHLRQSSSDRSDLLGTSPLEIAKKQLGALLATAIAFYTDLDAKLRSALAALPEHVCFQRNNSHHDALKGCIHTTLMALGDLARYVETHLAKQRTRNWTLAEKHYQDALRFGPFDGKAYNQLALLAGHQHQGLESVYLYARSLACQTPFAARENMIHAIELGKKEREEVRQLPNEQSHISTFRERYEVCNNLIMSCLHILLTNEGIEQWHNELDLTVKSLSYVLDASSSITEDKLEIQKMLKHISCLVIFAVHNAQCPIEGCQNIKRDDFDRPVSGWKESLSVQRALECAFSLLIVVMHHCGRAITERYVQNALEALSMTLPAINIFMGWLRLHPWFMEATDAGTQTFQIECLSLLCSMSSNALLADRLDCIGEELYSAAPEELELVGYLPCENMTSSLQNGPTSADSSGDDVLLDIRMGRFLSFKDFFVFSLTCGSPTSDGALQQPKMEASETNYHQMLHLDASADWSQYDRSCMCEQCFNASSFASGTCEFCGSNEHPSVLPLDPKNSELSALEGPEHVPLSDSNEAFFLDANKYGSRKSPVKKSSSPVPSTQRLYDPKAKTSGTKSMSKTPLANHLPASVRPEVLHQSLTRSTLRDTSDSARSRLIVLDAANVAMRHGMHKRFSCIGIRLAFDYFLQLNYQVVAFVPDYLLQEGEVNWRKKLVKGGRTTMNPAKMPDDVPLLQSMVEAGLLIPTPAQDYDDSYCIQYAGMHDGCVVTNDLFRDHVDSMVGSRERKAERRAWIASHRISYTWVGNEFFPNPNFRFPLPEK